MATSRAVVRGRAVLVAVSFVAIVVPGNVGCVSGPTMPDVATSSPVDDPLVDVRKADPRIVVRLPYATDDNFAGEVLYPVDRCLIRRSAMERLSRVQTALESIGYGLLVWDAYRPWSVQVAMWEAFPDPEFVADPARGSRHNRGMAVDVALVDASGRELEMPTGHDEFTAEAASDADVASDVAYMHREILKAAMVREGFTSLASEWWHFDAPGWEDAPLLDVGLDR